MEQLCSLKEDGNANRLHGTGIAPRDLSTTMEVNQTFEEEEVPNKDNNDDNIIIATSEENLPSSDEDKSSASLIQSLLQENEALKQENHELRNRIEQLENFHLSESHDKGKVVPAITPSQNEEKQAPPQQNETDSTARKVDPDFIRLFNAF